MGGSHSREEELETSESDDEHYQEDEDPHTPPSSSPQTPTHFQTPNSTLQQLDAKLRELELKHPPPHLQNSVQLYLHLGGTTPNARWVTSQNLTTYSFFKSPQSDDEDEGWWMFRVGSKVRVKVGTEMQAQMHGDQRRVDFVCRGVWSVKFLNGEDYRSFVAKYQECLFENTYGVEATDDNKMKIYGKDFIGWGKPEVADDSVWEADDGGGKSGAGDWGTPGRVRATQNLMGEFEEASGNGGIQSLALGALQNSFLVGDSGLQVVKNFGHGIEGKGVYVKFDNNGSSKFGSSFSRPKKALLMKAETNMLLMNSANLGDLHSTGLHQFDIETGRIVSEWKFGKDGVDITMRDITNDSKGAQLDPSESTFLGLDDNKLCRWDMRDRKGMVQDLATSAPVLHWTQGHQFSRGTNFQCFATTGDGSVVVGSLDGKIRLYSTTSMRQAKTAFPGLGAPITHVDVTYDGKWILGTTDTYLILVSTMFTYKDGIIKNGFNGRMGNRISAPRLLKLTPLDSHLAGENSKFHGGQFSWVTENGRQERHLVATVGKFSVIWNFQQVKNSKHECYQNQEGLKSCYCYKTVLKEESIVDSRFMHDNFAISDSPDAPLVVATPMKFSSFSISSKQ